MADGILSKLREKQQSYILFTFFRKPYSIRDAVNRVMVAAAIIAAIVLPIFLGRGSGDATEGASLDFAAKLAVAAYLHETIDSADEINLDGIIEEVRESSQDLSNDGDSRAILIERVAQLELVRDSRLSEGLSTLVQDVLRDLNEETGLGYLPRDGDASDRGALAPDFRLLDLEGNPHRLSEIDGPIVLNFWASWCEPCVEEMPDFEIINQELAGRVTFIGVNDGESLETAREFAYNVTKVQYLVLLDPTKSMTDGPYPLVGRPTTFFIGADGLIKELRVGIVDVDTLRGLVGDLVGEEVGAGSEQAMPEEYGEAALNIIDSARANFATAGELIQRWRDNPDVLSDPGWQRNMEAQTRVWSDLTEQFSGLTPPEQWSDLHQKVSDALAQIANAAGPLVRDAIEAASADGTNTAVTLYDSFRGQFDTAADNLSGVIETQQ